MVSIVKKPGRESITPRIVLGVKFYLAFLYFAFTIS